MEEVEAAQVVVQAQVQAQVQAAEDWGGLFFPAVVDAQVILQDVVQILQDVVQILQDVAQVLQDVALALQVAALLAAEVVAANWSGGREVRRRSAKPYTIVRFNPGPHKKKLSVFTESFYIKKPLKLLSKISSLNFSWKTYLI